MNAAVLPLSLAGQAKLKNTPVFVSFDALSAIFRDQRLYPTDGVALEVPGERLAELLPADHLAEVEGRVNTLLEAVRGLDRSQSGPEFTESTEKLTEALELAKNSKDEHELHYLASMFINERMVLRQLAKSPDLGEHTMLMLATVPELKQDRQIQLALAHNPALSDALMIKMIKETQDPFVINGIALNAVRRSLFIHDDNAYVRICEDLAKAADPTLRRLAISGVRSPELLRSIATDRPLMVTSRELEAVAGNKYTPDDVLNGMANKRWEVIDLVMGIDTADRARSTLANKRYEREREQTLTQRPT
jgi:hypothetical protein